MEGTMRLSRRRFLGNAGAVAAGFVGLHRYLNQGQVLGADFSYPVTKRQAHQSELKGYGELVVDPKRILDLPEGFQYTVMSNTGQIMSDGLQVPGAPDGMAAFPHDTDRCIVICNHELEDKQTFEGPYGITNELASRVPAEKMYDTGHGKYPQLGGTSTFVFNLKRQRVESHFLSLAGTIRNCAGGPTPWGTWISCEETVFVAGDHLDHNHGYNFEVPASAKMGLCDPVPLKAMGRFNHEAVAVDPATGIVYQTEDRDDGLITRFNPNVPGKLAEGGKLEALVVKDQASCDTRNWPDKGTPHIAVSSSLDVEWMPIDDPENLKDKMRADAFKAGSAIFARGEGMWYGSGKIYFACTSGGIGKGGQVFIYEPSPHEGTANESKQPGRLTLYLEPNNTQLLQYGDNLTIAPWGDVILCEDGADDQYLRGVTPEGRVYTLARNSYFGKSELCGVCFSPIESTLFVNIQRPGITLAVKGPWENLAKS